MARTTEELRRLWQPACTGPWAQTTLYGGAVVTVRPATVEAWQAFSLILLRWGYAATPPDCGGYVCRPITGGAGYSLHAYGVAVDVNWQNNPYGPRLVTDMPAGMIADIRAVRTNGGAQVFRWGGDYSGNKDAMHFEIVASPQELTAGIATAGAPAPTDASITYRSEPDDMYVRNQDNGEIWALSATTAKLLSGPEWDYRVRNETASAWPVTTLQLVAMTLVAGRVKV